MTTTPGDAGPTDFEGKVVPPYEGRRESADVEGEEALRRDGANVGGATGPVESAERKAPEPADTPRGAVASPADEQPAAGSPGNAPGPASVGPAHHPGTTRGEDMGGNSGDDFEDAGREDYDELGAGD
jgi:hypothetical protein